MTAIRIRCDQAGSLPFETINLTLEAVFDERVCGESSTDSKVVALGRGQKEESQIFLTAAYRSSGLFSDRRTYEQIDSTTVYDLLAEVKDTIDQLFLYSKKPRRHFRFF